MLIVQFLVVKKNYKKCTEHALK